MKEKKKRNFSFFFFSLSFFSLRGLFV